MPNKKYLITKTKVLIFKAPLIQPFRTALGQHDDLENILFVLELGDGTKGYGEAAIATHITGETINKTQENLKHLAGKLAGKNVCDYLKISAWLHEILPFNKSAVAAIETALIDALTRQLNIPFWRFFGQKSSKLTTDITIVLSSLKETEESAKRFYQQGFRSFKVKIGKDQDLDLKRVLAVKKIVKQAKIYLDANQGYSAEETLNFLKLLESKMILPDLIEQPVPKQDWEGLKKVTRLAKIPVCADESVCSVKDAIRAIREKAVNIINIKLMKSGIVQSREIALLAKHAGLDLMIGGMMESSLAMTAAAHLAVGLGCFKYTDLDTPFFLRKGIKDNPYLNSRGVYDLSGTKAGIGINIL